jgi:hypothetical protein
MFQQITGGGGNARVAEVSRNPERCLRRLKHVAILHFR